MQHMGLPCHTGQCEVEKCQTNFVVLQDMSAAPFAKLDMLELRPEGFPDYLEQELGFILARELYVATSSAGFNRPMYLFQRGM